jgi:hypothetical protein
MQGLITEHDLDQAETEFPGISELYASLDPKPATFLDLVARFEHWCEDATP